MSRNAHRRGPADGPAIGILMLDHVLERPAGDVGNPATYPFPVIYKTVKASSIDRLLHQRDRSLIEPLVKAGLELVEEGAAAVTTACGFWALFQMEVAAALPVPVFLSSLLQIPFIQRTLRPDETLGILTAHAERLTAEHLAIGGLDPSRPVKIVGLQDQPYFAGAILGQGKPLVFEKVEAEVVAQAKRLVSGAQRVGAILLECSNMPPYAAAVQAAVGRPVFDFNTMIHHVYSALVRQRYEGPIHRG